jgi:hypothetical protein
MPVARAAEGLGGGCKPGQRVSSDFWDSTWILRTATTTLVQRWVQRGGGGGGVMERPKKFCA